VPVAVSGKVVEPTTTFSGVDGTTPGVLGAVNVTVKSQDVLFAKLAHPAPPATVNGPVETGTVADTVLPE